MALDAEPNVEGSVYVGRDGRAAWTAGMFDGAYAEGRRYTRHIATCPGRATGKKK